MNTGQPFLPPISRRTLLGVAAAAGVTTLLGSCAAPSVTSSGSGPRTLVVWHNYTQDTRVAFIEAAGKAFEKANPGVTVAIEVVPNAQFNTKWPGAQAAGSLPDVTTILPENAVNMSLAGALNPMDDVLSDLGGENAFQPGLVKKVGVFRDEVMMLPHYVHNRLLIGRKDMMAAAGVTLPDAPSWDDVYKAATAMQNPPGQFGWILRLAQSDTGGGYLLYMLTRSTGGHLFDEKGKAMLETPEVRRAVDYLAQIARDASSPAQSTYAIADTFALMESGSTAFAEDSAALIGSTVLQAPDVAAQLTSTFMPADTQPGHLLGSFGFALPKSKNPELAKDFVKFMYDEENYVPFLKTIPLFMFPALAKIDEDSFYSDPTISQFRRTAEQSLEGIKVGNAPGFEYGPNAFAGTTFSSHVLEDAIQAIVVNGTDPGDALGAANTKLQGLLDEVAARTK